MLNPTTFREIVSGRRRGLLAGVVRGLLRLCEFPYSWVMRRRNARYDSGKAEVHRVGVPVVSVGNLSMGGTGKTPLVEWIARYLVRQRNLKVALVSRGYGAAADGVNDEAMELELALPEVPHEQNRDRVAAALTVIDEHGSQVIVLDDGFQHRRLGRDLDIVLLDATEPFGFRHVFPRGTLREPLAGLQRADVVMLSRADMIDEIAREEVRQHVELVAPEALWCEVVHGPAGLINSEGGMLSLDVLKRKRVAVFCGIGNPKGFRHTLDGLGCDIARWREFPDHYRYTEEDIASIADWASDADLVLCTRKDLVKVREVCLGEVPLWAVGIELRFLVGEESLKKKLKSTLNQRTGAPPSA